MVALAVNNTSSVVILQISADGLSTTHIKTFTNFGDGSYNSRGVAFNGTTLIRFYAYTSASQRRMAWTTTTDNWATNSSIETLNLTSVTGFGLYDPFTASMTDTYLAMWIPEVTSGNDPGNIYIIELSNLANLANTTSVIDASNASYVTKVTLPTSQTYSFLGFNSKSTGTPVMLNSDNSSFVVCRGGSGSQTLTNGTIFIYNNTGDNSWTLAQTISYDSTGSDIASSHTPWTIPYSFGFDHKTIAIGGYSYTGASPGSSGRIEIFEYNSSSGQYENAGLVTDPDSSHMGHLLTVSGNHIAAIGYNLRRIYIISKNDGTWETSSYQTHTYSVGSGFNNVGVHMWNNIVFQLYNNNLALLVPST